MENKTTEEIEHRYEDLTLLVQEFKNRGFTATQIRSLLQRQVTKLTDEIFGV